MARRRSTYVNRPAARRRTGRRAPSRGRSDSRRSGQILLTIVVLLIIWAHWKGQA